MTGVYIFLVVSLALALVSRASLRAPGSHGFYRFFAWEAILGLTLLNIGLWFDAPFSSRQIVSWILLLISSFLVVDGVRLLRLRGKPDAGRNDQTLLGIEKTTTLVTTGLYTHIRHPLYSSLLFLTWGVFFKDPSWVGFLLAAAATSLLVMTAKADEKECVRFFGREYEEYMTRTKMFVPFLL
jgi:protein-S-isoprenylcysteine O-methyltransferase Ste14